VKGVEAQLQDNILETANILKSARVIVMSHELDLHIEELRELSEKNPDEMEVVMEMMLEVEDELDEEITIE